MPTKTTLPKFRNFAELFGLEDLDISDVDPTSVRIITPHRDGEQFRRREFWRWLFNQMYSARHTAENCSCTFIQQRPGEELPPTAIDLVRKFSRIPVPVRYGPATEKVVSVDSLSLEHRNFGAVHLGKVTFLIGQEEADRLREGGISITEEKIFAKWKVILDAAQMQSITLHQDQILPLLLIYP